MKPILFAKRFVAGEKLNDAIRVSKELAEQGIKVTLDHLGEDVTSQSEANKSTKVYIKLLERIKKEGLDANIAVKLSQIGLAIDKQLALANTEQIFKVGKKLGLIVEVDMEGSKYTQDTIDIFLSLNKKYKNTVLAVQTCLFRTAGDINNLLKAGAKIRFVKGAYDESSSIAYQDMDKVVSNFIKLMKLYLDKGKFIEIATHDEKIINIAKRYIKRNKIPKNRFEFEMLYGVRRDLQEKLSKEYNMRAYVPYGNQWLPYFYRRIRERKENLFFALKHVLGR